MILHSEIFLMHTNRKFLSVCNSNFSKQKIRFLSSSWKSEDENLYHILGLTTDADQKQIKAHFFKLSKQYHPDKNPDDAAAASYFKQISEAYDVLSNPESKDDYDFRNGFLTKPSKTYIKPRRFAREAVHQTFNTYKDKFKEDVKIRLEKEGEKLNIFTEGTKKKYRDLETLNDNEEEHTRKMMEMIRPKWDFGENDDANQQKGSHGDKHNKSEHIKDDPVFYGTKTKGNEEMIQNWLKQSYENTSNFKENIKGMKNFRPFSYQQTSYENGRASTREVKMNPGVVVAVVFLIIVLPILEIITGDNYDLPKQPIKK